MTFIHHHEYVIILLDFSAVFDTIDHSISLEMIQSHIGVVASALEWFRSYLSCRTQKIVINGSESSTRPLNCGVPHGPILRPLLFTIYTRPISDIIKKHGLSYDILLMTVRIILVFIVDIFWKT